MGRWGASAPGNPCILDDDAALLNTPLKYSRWLSICTPPASTAAVPPIGAASGLSSALLVSSAEAGAGLGPLDAEEAAAEVGASMRHAKLRFLMNGFAISSGPGPRFAAIIDQFDVS